MKELDYAEIGQRVKIQRLNHKLTQAQLAELVDVGTSYISEIERGNSICSLAVIAKISIVLEMNLDNLIFGINISNADTTFKEMIRNIPEKNQKLYISLCTNIIESLKD